MSETPKKKCRRSQFVSVGLIAITFITLVGGTLTCIVTGHPIWAFIWFWVWGAVLLAFIDSSGESK